MKNGCNNALDEVILLFGSNCNNFDNKSIPLSDIGFTTFDNDSALGGVYLIELVYVLSCALLA